MSSCILSFILDLFVVGVSLQESRGYMCTISYFRIDCGVENWDQSPVMSALYCKLPKEYGAYGAYCAIVRVPRPEMGVNYNIM